MANEPQWTVLHLLQWTAEYLSQKGVNNARLQAERMLAHVLHCQRVGLYLCFDRPLSADELAAFKALLKRRLAHEPLQYILGETEFMSLRVFVGPGVLIPRPETEVLVERVIALAADKALRVLDIGTGSGNMAVAIAKYAGQTSVHAIDCSAAALAYARKNAELHGVDERIVFSLADIRSAGIEEIGGDFHLIVTNPPYVSAADYADLPAEIKDFEPEIALAAGETGLEFYGLLAAKLPAFCRTDGTQVFLEIGAAQGEAVSALFQNKGFSNVLVVKDLAEKNRIVQMLYSRREP